MKIYNSFSEIENDMITPKINDDFYKLILDGYGKFSTRFDYDLNPNGFNDIMDFTYREAKLKAKVFLKYILNMSDDEKKQKIKGIANPGFISYLKNISEMSYDKYLELVKLNNTAIDEKSSIAKKKLNFLKKALRDTNEECFCCHTGSFDYFRSYRLCPSREEEFHSADIKHRLYISINVDQAMNFIEDFVNELEKEELPYYFKFLIPRFNRKQQIIKCFQNDTLVVYADTEERTIQYVNIINSILEKKPEYRNSIHKPNGHFGRINDFIGYGKEFSKGTSYSSVFEDCSFPMSAIDEVNNKYGTNYNRADMLELLNKSDSESVEIVNFFKEKYWEKFYESAAKDGYSLDDCICFTKDKMSEMKVEKKDEPFVPIDISIYPSYDNNTVVNRGKSDTKKKIDDAISRLNIRVIDVPTYKVVRKNISGTMTRCPNILDEHVDEYIPGTQIYKPRYRGIYETESEYVEFLRKYYDAAFGNVSSNDISNMFVDRSVEKKNRNIYVPMTNDEIMKARDNIEYDKYEDIYSKKFVFSDSSDSFEQLRKKVKELQEMKKKQLRRQQEVANEAIAVEKAARDAKERIQHDRIKYIDKLQKLREYTSSLEDECLNIQNNNTSALENVEETEKFIFEEESKNNELMQISDEIDSIIGVSSRSRR